MYDAHGVSQVTFQLSPLLAEDSSSSSLLNPSVHLLPSYQNLLAFISFPISVFIDLHHFLFFKSLKQENSRKTSISTRKGRFSFQSQRKAMPNNVQTTAQLHSSHTLAK